MGINRAAIKANAKGQMRTAKPHAVVVAIVYIAVLWVLDFLVTRIGGMSMSLSSMNMDYIEVPELFLMEYMKSFSMVSALLSLALSVMTTVLAAGFTVYSLRVSRLQQAGFANLLDGFTMFLRVIVLVILQGLFVFLWSLLFVIPGIIAAYRYRMALYLLIDNPGMSPLACIRASKQLMTGRKGELFVLDLSFIGWSLLTVIPFVSFWVTPYMEVTYANYYNALLGLHNGSAGGGYPGGDQRQQPEPERQYDREQQERPKWNDNERPPWEL